MTKTSNIFARVEPNLKEQAENVLDQLGLSMSNAIGIFLRQIVIQQGIPFEMKLADKKPLALGNITEMQFNEEMEKGYTDMLEGRVRPATEVYAELKKAYHI